MYHHLAVVRWEQGHRQGSGADTNHWDNDEEDQESVRQTLQPSEQALSSAPGLRLPVCKQLQNAKEPHTEDYSDTED